MAEQKVESGRIATGAITGDKIAGNSIRGNNIVAGTITGNLIAAGSISASQITGSSVTNNILSVGAITITTNLIATGAIQGNQLGAFSVSTNNILGGTIQGNLIGVGAVSANHFSSPITGNLIGTGSISSNHIVSGALTGNTLSANIQFNSSRIVETVNVSTIAASGNVNIDVSNATVHYFTANTTANVTFNLRANSNYMLDSILANGQSVSVAIGLSQGATQYQANIYIDGVLQSANTRWMGNTRPNYNVSIGNAFTDFYSITAIKIGSNSYAVLAGNTVFGVGV
jgi:hypothetical protein